VELEGAVYTKASFDKAPDDPSAVPTHFEESGLGDVETQLRWRWRAETADRPELYSFVKVVFPLQKDQVLVGTSDWEGEVGFGAVRGYRWGTVTGRATLAWDGEDQKVELGEYAVEYLKRVSPAWRLVASLEGESEDLVVVGEAQWHFSPRGFVKLNCGLGITEKPRIGARGGRALPLLSGAVSSVSHAHPGHRGAIVGGRERFVRAPIGAAAERGACGCRVDTGLSTASGCTPASTAPPRPNPDGVEHRRHAIAAVSSAARPTGSADRRGPLRRRRGRRCTTPTRIRPG
jgi:hypothetical protein